MKENAARYTIINPKAMPMGQLYGEFDPGQSYFKIFILDCISFASTIAFDCIGCL